MIETKKPSPEDISNAIIAIEQHFETQLKENIRYERYRANETNEEWVEFLGGDVLFATHPYATQAIIDRLVAENTLDAQSVQDLRTASLIHDWGELSIDGEGVGDISYDQKTNADEQEEYSIFKKVISPLAPSVRNYFYHLYTTIVRNRTSALGEIFNAAERIGYLETGLRAFVGENNKHITNWEGLSANVMSNQIIPLIALAEKYPAVKNILDSHYNTLNTLFAHDWTTSHQAQRELGKDAMYDPQKFEEARDAWRASTENTTLTS